jgi:hypothetical protein
LHRQFLARIHFSRTIHEQSTIASGEKAVYILFARMPGALPAHPSLRRNNVNRRMNGRELPSVTPQVSTLARSLAIGAVAMLCLAAAVLAGGDPWKTKPYKQWDAKDMQKILGDSPWSKVIVVSAPWKTSGGGDDDDDAGGLKNGTGTRDNSMSADAVSSGVAQGGGPPQAKYLLRWVSSRTVREALYHGAVVANQMKEDDADKQLAAPVDAYQILVLGPDMKPFRGADETELKKGAFLTSKKTKQKIAAIGVLMARSSDGKSVKSILFSFPKKTASGESTIAADEKSVDILIAIGTVKIPATFDISKMDDSQGRDL